MKASSSIFLVLAFEFVHGLNYKFLKIENCSSSDEKIVLIETCSVALSDINITINIQRPLNNFHVSLQQTQDFRPKGFFSGSRRVVQQTKFRVSTILQSA